MKNFLFLILALVLSVGANAAYPSPQDTAFLMNQGYGSTVQLGTQIVDKKVHILRAQYDYAVDGGLSGSYTLKDLDGKAAVLPDNAIVVDCLIDVITAMTSSAFPKVAFGTGQSSTDLKASNFLNAYSGLTACTPVGSAATSIKMTAQRNPTITVTTASTTVAHSVLAGKVNVLIWWILGE